MMDTERFFSLTFSSSKDFIEKLKEFQNNTFAAFRKKTSESSAKSNERTKHKIETDLFSHSRTVYVCTHYGQHAPRGEGKKAQTKHTTTGCKAFFVVNYDYKDKLLKITKSEISHNHPTTPSTYSQEYQVKRLDARQRHALKELVELNLSNENLLHLINSKYGKAFSLTEIRRLKYQCKYTY